MKRDQDYQEIAQRMKEDAFHKGCEISVLVEDIYDERFWECIIENVKPDLKNKIDFPNPTPEGTRGKHILKKFKNFVDAKFIICVDSDCEYLYDNNIWYIAKYIYHTVVYSKENFQCHHLSLNDICKDLTTKSYNNFERLLENISLKISPVFYLWLYLQGISYNQSDQSINNETFKNILIFEGTQFENIGDENILYQNIEDRVNNILKTLKDKMDEIWYDPTFENDIPEIRQKLREQYSIKEEDILAFCSGHIVFEEFVQPFMVKLIEILKTLKIEEVKQTLNQASETVIHERISSIEKMAKQDIKTKLSDSFKYVIYNNADQKLQEIKAKLAKELN
jgi:hypothetical protein